MKRSRESAADELRHESKADRRKAFHVGRAATVQAPVFQRRFERWRVPRLTIDRNDVGVAGQDDAADCRVAIAGGQRREQVRFAAFVVKGERLQRTERFEIPPRPFDQRKVRFAARRVVPDPLADQRQSDETLGGDRCAVLLAAAGGEHVHRQFIRSNCPSSCGLGDHCSAGHARMRPLVPIVLDTMRCAARLGIGSRNRTRLQDSYAMWAVN